MALTRCSDSRFVTDTAALPSVEVDSDHKLMYVAFKASPCSRDSDLREGEPETVYKDTPKEIDSGKAERRGKEERICRHIERRTTEARRQH